MKLLALFLAVMVLLLASYCTATVQAMLYLLTFIGLWWLFAKPENSSK
ncbi:hypothetical protein L9G15_10650 [Shewanella sp. A3A]|nr:hypothetical protein [Shewanella ferrihydritica]